MNVGLLCDGRCCWDGMCAYSERCASWTLLHCAQQVLARALQTSRASSACRRLALGRVAVHA
jgi:hypothetical protein